MYANEESCVDVAWIVHRGRCGIGWGLGGGMGLVNRVGDQSAD